MAILVVDDDDDIRDAVQDVLESEGYKTLGACNGQEALDLLRTERDRPSLVLLDLMMPEMDGWEFLSKVDAEPALRGMPVALMSAHPSVRKAFDKSPNALASRLLLPKPLNLLRLLAVVHDICSTGTEPMSDEARARTITNRPKN